MFPYTLVQVDEIAVLIIASTYIRGQAFISYYIVTLHLLRALIDSKKDYSLLVEM